MQFNQIINVTEKAVTTLSNDYKDQVLEGKEAFNKLYGKIDDESVDYENQTFLFQYWILFQFQTEHLCTKDWFLGQLVPSMKDSFEKMTWSVFEYQGQNLFKNKYIKDVLNKKKMQLLDEKSNPLLFKGDLFVGRVIPFEEKYFLLPGLSMLPTEIYSTIKKRAKRLNAEKNSEYLQEISINASRWNRYDNKNYKKIFNI